MIEFSMPPPDNGTTKTSKHVDKLCHLAAKKRQLLLPLHGTTLLESSSARGIRNNDLLGFNSVSFHSQNENISLLTSFLVKKLQACVVCTHTHTRAQTGAACLINIEAN